MPDLPQRAQALDVLPAPCGTPVHAGKIVAFQARLLARATAKAIVASTQIARNGESYRLKNGWRFPFLVNGHSLGVDLSDAVYVMIHVGHLVDSYVAGLPGFAERLDALVALRMDLHPGNKPRHILLEIADI